MTDYEIKRIAREVVKLLLDDDRFTSSIGKTCQNEGMVNSRKAAEILGVSQYTLRSIAPYIGGIKKGSDRRQHWCFDTKNLLSNYKKYIGAL